MLELVILADGCNTSHWAVAFGHFYAYAPVKIEYAIDRYTTEVKRQLDLLDKRLATNTYICGDESIRLPIWLSTLGTAQ